MKQPTPNHAGRLATIRRAPLFSALSTDVLERLVAQCQQPQLASGATVFVEGAPAMAFFLVLSGRIKVYKVSAGGDEQILHHYAAGATFGEAAVLANVPYPASAQVVAAATLLRIERGALHAAIAADPELGLGLLAGLSAKLREFTRLIARLSLQDVRARVADVLLQMSAELRASGFRLPQSKRQLAFELGTTPESISRALGALRREGLIEMAGSQITIKDMDGLRGLVQRPAAGP